MLEIDRDLKDMIISAFRYAIGRKTYITLATCDYIRNHPELIDDRVKGVMLRDLESLDMYYPNKGIDYDTFKDFEKWLNNLVVE